MKNNLKQSLICWAVIIILAVIWGLMMARGCEKQYAEMDGNFEVSLQIQVEVQMQIIDSLAVIFEILNEDKKECRLIDHWTEAPIVMLHYAKVFKIDPYLLPCISRVEGPTKTMLDSSNIYGFEINGKYLNMGNFDYATEAAAALLEMYKPRYQANGLVNIDTLAAIWCPISKELWAKNMKEIYLKALTPPQGGK